MLVGTKVFQREGKNNNKKTVALKVGFTPTDLGGYA